MPAPDPSWDCPCGVRNAGTFCRCRRCSAPRPAPPRDPDEWLKTRVGTPWQRDIIPGMWFILLQLAVPVLWVLTFLACLWGMVHPN